MNEEARRCVETIRHCSTGNDGNHCKECPYLNSDTLEKPCVNILFSDAADLIKSLSEQLEQVTRERDAAIEDLREADRIDCEHCIAYKLYDDDMCIDADYMCADCLKECRCKTCRNNSNWQWRGVEVEG